MFLFIGAIILGFYFYNKNKGTNTQNPIYNLYNKFTSNPTTDIKTGGEGGGTEGGTTTQKPTEVVTTSRLKKLTDFSISGAGFFNEKKLIPTQPITQNTTPDTTIKGKIKTLAPAKITPNYELIPSLRYVEKATGHIYQMNVLTGVSGKISNSTVLNVYETIFDGTTNFVIYRYVSQGEKTITSFLASLGGKSDFLNADILQMSLSPEKDRFFSIIKTVNGSIGTIKSFSDPKTSQVFTSALSEWLPQWVTEKNIFMTTKPSYLVNGSVFSLNTQNGTLTKVLGGIPGLTTLANKDGSILLFGASLENGPKLNSFNIANHISIDLGVYGLPEKCIWSNDNVTVYCAVPKTIIGSQYPDSWYQGLTSFNDYFIKINTQTKEVSTLTNPSDDEPIDAINLFISDTENKIFFTNKIDYTLWSLDL